MEKTNIRIGKMRKQKMKKIKMRLRERGRYELSLNMLLVVESNIREDHKLKEIRNNNL